MHIENEQNTLDSAITGALADANSGGSTVEAPGAPAGAPAADQGAPAAAAPPLPELDAPHFWEPGAREAWKALHGWAEGRPHLEAVHKQWGKTQSMFTQLQQQNSEYRRQFEPLGQMLAPYAQKWAREGLDTVGGLRAMLSWRDAIEQDPGGTILELARHFGVDLQQAVEGQPYVDPTTQALQSQVEALTQQLQQFQTSAQQSQQQQQAEYFFSQLRAFETAADAQGNLLHPFLDQNVLHNMSHFHATGQARDPEEAYQLAVQLSPAYREAAAKQAEQKAIAEANAKRQEAAQRSAIAGKPTAGTGDRGARGKTSLDDAIRSAMAGE